MQFCKAKANLIYLSPALDPALKMLQVRRAASEPDDEFSLSRSPSLLSLSFRLTCVVVVVVGSEFRCCAVGGKKRGLVVHLARGSGLMAAERAWMDSA